MFNKISNTYLLSDTINANLEEVYKDTIEIYNNGQFTLDLTSLRVSCSDSSIQNSEIIKIRIDWGDGQKDTISKSILSNSSSIGFYDEMDWKTITHVFNTDKRNVYLTDDVKALPKIRIKAFTTFNDSVVINIPYKLIYKSLYDLGTDFSLMNGNISNDNHSSFILKNNKENNMVVISVRDWKKIYGDDEIIYINDDNVSIDYSDEYISEESVVWDWDSLPSISLRSELKTKKIGNTDVVYLHCYFTEDAVQLQSWQPHCYLLNDSGDVQITHIESDLDAKSFDVYNKDKKDNIISLVNGMYKIWVDINGINGLKGSSEIIYKDKGKSASDKLQIPVGVQFSQKVGNSLVVRYCLPDGAFVSHIKYAKLYLITQKYDNSDNGLGDEFTKGDKLMFEIPLDFTKEKATDDYYTVKIPYKMIPNGEYSFAFEVKELSKDNITAPEENIYNGSSVYKPANHTISYTDIGKITKPQIGIKDSNIEIKWSITKPAELDVVNYRFSKTTNDYSAVEKYITDSHKNYYNYNYVYDSGTDTYSFTELIPCESILDGYYKAEVFHVLPMDYYVGQRQEANSTTYRYTYPCPQMKIQNINPYYKRIGNSFVTHLHIEVQKHNQQVEDVQIDFYTNTIKDGVSYLCDDLSYQANLRNLSSFEKIAARAYNKIDKEHKRKEETPTYTSSVETLTTIMPSQIVGDFENVSRSIEYVNESTNKVFSGEELLNQTAYNVKKNYKWIDQNSQQFYGVNQGAEYNVHINNDSMNFKKKMLFKGQTYKSLDGNETIVYRYRPYTFDGDFEEWENGKSKSALISVGDYLTTENKLQFSKIYDKDTDRFTLQVKPFDPFYKKHVKQVGQAVYTLKNKNSDYKRIINGRRSSIINFFDLPVGDYNLELDLQTTNLDSVSKTTHDEDYQLKVDYTDVLSQSNSILTFKDQKGVKINWNIHHEGIMGQTLHWTSVSTTTTKKHYYNTLGSVFQENGKDKVEESTDTKNSSGTKAILTKQGSFETNLYQVGTTQTQSTWTQGGVTKGKIITVVTKKTVITYWFSFDGSYVNWDENQNKIYPQSKVTINLT